MQNLKLSSVRLYELSTVFDSLQPKDLADLKEIRLATAIVKDLQAGCKPYYDKAVDLLLKKQSVLEKYKKRFDSESAEMEKEEKDKFAKSLDLEFQAEVKEKLKKEIEETDKEATSLCEIELGDEKFAKLKEIFTKKGKEFYTDKKAYLEVVDALGIE